MNYTIKSTILRVKDSSPLNRFDARITECKTKGFKFDLSIPIPLKVGDTIELARLPNGSDLTGIILENTFDGVTYTIGTTSGQANTLGTSKKAKFYNFIAPLESDGASIYLTITAGDVEIGSYIKGLVQFIGA